MQDTRKENQVGNGIFKVSAAPVKFYVDSDGEYWICDASVDPSKGNFREQGCTPHSEVHLVK